MRVDIQGRAFDKKKGLKALRSDFAIYEKITLTRCLNKRPENSNARVSLSMRHLPKTLYYCPLKDHNKYYWPTQTIVASKIARH